MMRHLAGTIATAALVVALTGCAATPSPIQASASTQLQSGVKAIAVASSTGEYTLASSRLDALQKKLTLVISDGTVTATRAAQIQTLIDEVRADLSALTAPVAPTVTTPSPTPSFPGQRSPGPGFPKKGHDKHNRNNG